MPPTNTNTPENSSNEPQNLDGIIIEPGAGSAEVSDKTQSAQPPSTPTTPAPVQKEEAPEHVPPILEQPIDAPKAKKEVVSENIDIAIPSKKPDTSETKKPNVDIKAKDALRTYEDDVAQAMREKKSSVASIRAAEQLKKEEEKRNTPKKESSKKRFNISIKINWNQVFYTLLVILILLATATVITIIMDSRGAKIIETQRDALRVENFFLVESQIEIPTDERGAREITTTVNTAGEKGSLGEISQLFYTTSSADGSRHILTFQEFSTLLGFNTPDLLLRNTLPVFMFGFHVFDGSHPLMVLKNTSIARTFAGMLEWEKTLQRDLGGIFETNSTNPLRVGTTTEQTFNSRGAFDDIVIQNRDARILRNSAGEILLLYSFITDDTLVITTSEDTLVEVINRIERVRFSR